MAPKYRMMIERARKRYRRRRIYLFASLSVASCLIAFILLGPSLTQRIDRNELFSRYYEPFDFQTEHRSKVSETDISSNAFILFQNGKLLESQEAVQTLLSTHPGQPDYQLLLSTIYIEQDKFIKAIAQLELVADQGGSYKSISLWYIGLCRLALNQFDRAKSIFKQLSQDNRSHLGKKSQKIYSALRKKTPKD